MLSRPLQLCHIILIAVICQLNASCTKSTPQLTKLPADATIVTFGDSLTFGSGVKNDFSYPAVLKSLTVLEIINAGIPGETSAQGLMRLPTVLDQYQPHLLILCHGGNDLLRKLDKSQLANNLTAMIEMARARGIDVMLLGVPEPKLMFLKSAQLYQEVADKARIPIESEIIATVVGNSNLKSDTIHPNAQGYKMIAEAVYKLMQQSGSL